MAKPSTGHHLRPWVPPLLYLVATVVFTWPLASRPGELFIDGQFQWSQIWTTGLISHALDSSAGWSSHTEMFNYPNGGSVILVGWSIHVVAVILNRVLPLVLAFNLAVLLHLWAAAYAAFLLFRRLSGSELGALGGGMVFGFSHVALIALHLGQIHQYSHCWISLFLLALIRCCERLSLPRLGGLALATAGLLFSTPQGALATALLTPVLCAWLFFRERVSPRLLLRLAAIVAVCLPVVFLSYQYLHGCAHDSLGAPQNISLMEDSSGAQPSLGLLWTHELVLPAANRSSQMVITTGLAAFLLGVAGLLGPARRKVVFWSLIWLAFVLLAIGKTATIGERTVRLPLWYLSWAIPVFVRIKFSWRFMAAAFLALGAMVSWGLPVVTGWFPVRVRRPAAAALLALLFLEVLQPVTQFAYPVPVAPSRVPRVYHDLTRAAGRAIIEFPVMLGLDGPLQTLTDRTLFYQTVHRRPIAHTCKNNLLQSPTFQNPMLSTLSTGCLQGACEVGADEWQGLSSLVRWGFTDLILHEDYLDDGNRQAVKQYLDTLLSVKREYPEDDIIWYKVATPSAPLQD